jgi:hypothetical protein
MGLQVGGVDEVSSAGMRGEKSEELIPLRYAYLPDPSTFPDAWLPA